VYDDPTKGQRGFNGNPSTRMKQQENLSQHVTSLHAVEIVNIDWNIDMGSLYATLDELTSGLTNVNLQLTTNQNFVSGILFYGTKQEAERAVSKLDKSVLEGRILYLRMIPNPFAVENEIPKSPNTEKEKYRRKFRLPLLAVLISALLALFTTSFRNPNTSLEDYVTKLRQEYKGRMNVLEFPFTESQKGIVHHVGTGGDLWEYANPAHSGAIRITQYPSTWGRGVNYALQRDGKQWSFTGPAEDGDFAYYEIDFGETRKIVPTHYTIRSLPLGSRKNSGELRHWIFEASVDSENWIELRYHSGSWWSWWWFGGDTSIQGDQAASWSVDTTNTNNTPFRYLRIRQLGDNTHSDMSKRSVLFLSGFEVFGVLLESS
jgi:hypothetical protein